MNFTIIGSGGCVALPKPTCMCEVCQQARKEGAPYARHGCSLYLEDIRLLFDTPEDIVSALNDSKIAGIDYATFSHIDPDHTMGMRLFEHLRLSWLDVSIGKSCENPIKVFALPNVLEDVTSIGSRRGSMMDYYEYAHHLIEREAVQREKIIDGIKITLVPAGISTAFVIEKERKKLIYAPCDAKPFPADDIFYDADVLIVGSVVPDYVLKDGFVMAPENKMLAEMLTLGEVKEITDQYDIKKTIITHIEEDYGRSYDDYIKLQEKYENLIFAYDGMKIILGEPHGD